MIVWQQLFFAFHLSSFFSGITYQGLSPQQLCKKLFTLSSKDKKLFGGRAQHLSLSTKLDGKSTTRRKQRCFYCFSDAGSEEENTTKTQQAPLEKSIIKCSGKVRLLGSIDNA